MDLLNDDFDSMDLLNDDFDSMDLLNDDVDEEYEKYCIPYDEIELVPIGAPNYYSQDTTNLALTYEMMQLLIGNCEQSDYWLILKSMYYTCKFYHENLNKPSAYIPLKNSLFLSSGISGFSHLIEKFENATIYHKIKYLPNNYKYKLSKIVRMINSYLNNCPFSLDQILIAIIETGNGLFLLKTLQMCKKENKICSISHKVLNYVTSYKYSLLLDVVITFAIENNINFDKSHFIERLIDLYDIQLMKKWIKCLKQKPEITLAQFHTIAQNSSKNPEFSFYCLRKLMKQNILDLWYFTEFMFNQPEILPLIKNDLQFCTKLVNHYNIAQDFHKINDENKQPFLEIISQVFTFGGLQ
jgi:hypothetical protein